MPVTNKPTITLRTEIREVPEVVKVSPQAGAVLRRLQARTGISMRTLVSEILIQAEPLIVIEGERDGVPQ